MQRMNKNFPKFHYTSRCHCILKIAKFEKEKEKGNSIQQIVIHPNLDRYLNEEILRAWPRHGMEWQLKLDSSYFRRYFSPLWLRFFSSSSSSFLFFSLVFLDSCRNIFGPIHAKPLLWWERDRFFMTAMGSPVLFARSFFFSKGTPG